MGQPNADDIDEMNSSHPKAYSDYFRVTADDVDGKFAGRVDTVGVDDLDALADHIL
jgi:hypothetical protein